jgi:prepilin peptidase CpaA
LAPVASGLALVVLSSVAVWIDVRERRIPNWVSLATLGSGIGFALIQGPAFAGVTVLVVAAAFLFGLVFFLLGGLGAGDVKFMAGSAAYVGAEGILVGLLVMALVGAIMAVGASVRKRQFKRVLTNVGLILMSLSPRSFRGWKGEGVGPTLARPGPDAVSSPYAVAIALGAIAGWIHAHGGLGA